jgi:serine/threonine protein phosphatase PrpC
MLASPPMFVVADGMGGHAAGDVASHLAIQSLGDLVRSEPISMEDVIEAVISANRTIVDAAASDTEHSGMGTTIAGLALVSAGGSEHWMVFNVGDSRVYRLDNGKLSQLTIDHSEVQELLSSGQITTDEARRYRRRNVVTRSLGSEPAEAIDSWVFPPTSGERFLICSDGLTGELQDEVIEDCLERIADPQLAAQALLQRAIDAGGSDNITVLIVDGGLIDEDDPLDDDTMPRRQHVH